MEFFLFCYIIRRTAGRNTFLQREENKYEGNQLRILCKLYI